MIKNYTYAVLFKYFKFNEKCFTVSPTENIMSFITNSLTGWLSMHHDIIFHVIYVIFQILYAAGVHVSNNLASRLNGFLYFFFFCWFLK